MVYETDERLKNRLDTNQLGREQLCLAILALDKRFSDVKPRHPRGGPDGGRDIEALFRGEDLAYGAVGFANQAADIEEKKRTIRNKFKEDLESAWEANPRPSMFVFFTNVNLTIGEKGALESLAVARGFTRCEILDRERLRIALDNPDGFAARYQYLGLPMSESEQAAFFAKWGDDIQSVIATGFQSIHATLEHLLFLQEAGLPINGLSVHLELDREYPADDIGHFRAFCSILLREPKLRILGLLFGSTDKANRFLEETTPHKNDNAGIRNGIATAQWHSRWPRDEQETYDALGDNNLYEICGSGSGMGWPTVSRIVCLYSTPMFIRPEPTLSLIDFDECMLMPILNKSLAEKIHRVSVYAGSYKLLDVPKSRFSVDYSPTNFEVATTFSDSELSDPWVRLRPSNHSSTFQLHFANNVPVRIFKSKRASDVE